MKKKYKVGENIKIKVGNWKFNTQVAKVFDIHAKRSIPFYEVGHNLILKISHFFLKDKSIICDLGSSTGTLVKKLNEEHAKKTPGVKYYCIESEKSMINQSKKKLKNLKKVTFVNKKLENYKIPKSDLIISYYTLQFIKPNLRQKILKNIYNSLNWGGALILFEKTRSEDARFQDLITQLYNEFKLDNGYNPNEIINKTLSLKGVLEPFSLNGNEGLLSRAGFKFRKAGFDDTTILFRYLNFTGFLLIK